MQIQIQYKQAIRGIMLRNIKHRYQRVRVTSY